MRIFLSYKFSGVTTDALNATVVVLIKHLRALGHDVFCNLEKDVMYVAEKYTTRQIMQDCFRELDRSTHHISFVAPNTSIGEGMPMELGYALKAGLQTCLIIPVGVTSTSMQAVVDRIVVYSDMTELVSNFDCSKAETAFSLRT